MDDPVQPKFPAMFSNHTSASDQNPSNKRKKRLEKRTKEMEKNKHAFTKNMSFILLALKLYDHMSGQ